MKNCSRGRTSTAGPTVSGSRTKVSAMAGHSMHHPVHHASCIPRLTWGANVACSFSIMLDFAISSACCGTVPTRQVAPFGVAGRRDAVLPYHFCSWPKKCCRCRLVPQLLRAASLRHTVVRCCADAQDASLRLLEGYSATAPSRLCYQVELQHDPHPARPHVLICQELTANRETGRLMHMPSMQVSCQDHPLSSVGSRSE